jgi:F0F1-type ATP synthase assembly protein I
MADNKKPKMAVFIAIGFEIVGLIVVGIELGKILDAKFGWNGYGVAGMSVLALTVWIVHLSVLLKNYE